MLVLLLQAAPLCYQEVHVLVREALSLSNCKSVLKQGCQTPRTEAKKPFRGAADFANGSAGGKFVTSSGQWLDHPVGVLQATNGSANMTSALVSLASPRYDATRKTLTFQVRLIWLWTVFRCSAK